MSPSSMATAGKGVDCVRFNGSPERELRAIRDAVQELIQESP